jgi:hypothetical protein
MVPAPTASAASVSAIRRRTAGGDHQDHRRPGMGELRDPGAAAATVICRTLRARRNAATLGMSRHRRSMIPGDRVPNRKFPGRRDRWCAPVALVSVQTQLASAPYASQDKAERLGYPATGEVRPLDALVGFSRPAITLDQARQQTPPCRWPSKCHRPSPASARPAVGDR